MTLLHYGIAGILVCCDLSLIIYHLFIIIIYFDEACIVFRIECCFVPIWNGLTWSRSWSPPVGFGIPFLSVYVQPWSYSHTGFDLQLYLSLHLHIYDYLFSNELSYASLWFTIHESYNSFVMPVQWVNNEAWIYTLYNLVSGSLHSCIVCCIVHCFKVSHVKLIHWYVSVVWLFLYLGLALRSSLYLPKVMRCDVV